MTERAQRTLERFEARRPDAFRLAMLASLAVRVDAHLLRRLRTTLTPDADVGVEADLWFSPLVESRGVHGFVMAADVTTLLRELLAQQPALLERAHAVTAAAHGQAPATIRLEEKVNALALRAAGTAIAQIDEALRPAVLALVRDERRGLDIARWAMRALPRFHPRVHEAESAVLLAIGAAARLDTRLDRPDVTTGVTTTIDARWVLPSAVRDELVVIGVELLADGVRFVEEGKGSALSLPRTMPLLLHVLWDDGGTERRRTIEARPGRTERFGTTVNEVRFRTLTGDEFSLEADPVRTGSDAALVEIELLGSNGPVTSGFIVAPDRIVTAAEPFRGIPFLAVRHGSRSFQAEVIHPLEGTRAVQLHADAASAASEIMILAPIDSPPLAPVLPLQTRLSRIDPRQSSVMIAEILADVRWVEGRDIASVEATMGVQHDGPSTLTLSTEKSADPQTPPPRQGAPLLVRGEAVGVVARVESGGIMPTPVLPGGPFRIHAIGAAVIEKVLGALGPETLGSPDRGTVATVTVKPAFVVLKSGAQQTFLAETRDARGNILEDRVVAWRSKKNEVFQFDEPIGLRVQGTAAKPGEATVEAACEGMSGSATVAVMAPATKEEQYRVTAVPFIDLRRERPQELLSALLGFRRNRWNVLELRDAEDPPGLTADMYIHAVTDHPAWPRAFDVDEVGAMLIAIDPREDPDASNLRRALHTLGVGAAPNQLRAVVIAVDRNQSFAYDGENVFQLPGTEYLSVHLDDPNPHERLGAALARLIGWQDQPGGSREEFERMRGLLGRVEGRNYPPVLPLPEFVKEAGDIRAAHAARIAGAHILESGGEVGVAVLDEKLFENVVLTIMDSTRVEGGFHGPLPVLPLEEMRRRAHGVISEFRVPQELHDPVFDGVIAELERIGVLGVGRGIDGSWLVYPDAFEPTGPIASGPEIADPLLIARSATPALRELLLAALDFHASEQYDIRGAYWRTPPRRGIEIADRRSGVPLYLEYEPGDEYQIVLRVAYGTDPESRAGLAESVEKRLRSLPHSWITIERPGADDSAASMQAPM